MKVMKLEDMFKGWFIGDFEPTAYKSKILKFVIEFIQRVKSGNGIITKRLPR